MRGITGWHYHPYRPASKQAQARLPFICRIAPCETHIEIEWFDHDFSGAHELRWRSMDSKDEWNALPLPQSRARIEGLAEGGQYELQITRAEPAEGASAVRYARCARVPGRIINYLHPRDELYAFSGRALCSPCIVKLPSGALMCSMDLYAPGAPQNLELLFRSDDGGESWRYVNDLFPCYWATLFMHAGRLYALACTTEYGDIAIGVSDDEGETFSRPVHLFSGSSSPLEEGWQRAPMPILRSGGRLITSIDYGAWRKGGHAIGMLSIGEDQDLLEPENWLCTDLISYDPRWQGAPRGDCTGLLEGNMLAGRDGELYNLLRVQMAGCEPNHGRAVLLKAGKDNFEAALSFHRFIDMPSGSNSKTHVVFDEVSGRYVAIGNICVDERYPAQRNVLALMSSPDLYDWRVNSILLDYRQEDSSMVGFQYISFIIDGADILYQSRTSLHGARNFHDANYMTFHKVESFRDLL